MTAQQSPSDPSAALAARAAAVLREAAGLDSVDLAVVLGSGWTQAADLIGTTVASVAAEQLPGFHVSGVPGHSGRVTVVRSAAGQTVLVIGARTHLYQGLGVDAVTHGVRAAAALGAHAVVLTNGCGGIDPALAPGTPVLIADHINLTGESALRGPRFIDCTEVYSARLRSLAREVAPELPEGVYAQFRGPQYETPAEVRMARTLGADLVGMSTALEAVAARAEGLEVLGLSLVTNLAAGVSATPLSHAEVMEAGRSAAPVITKLLADIVGKIA
ncbi:purine-nucleoside phosphorylase [Pseudoclavibacter soli]|uniref:purine-nucleoside phosphorylase n=1 Tax=Pseudoclavibacter soli TaxID=452623 RepID=UPI00040A09E4|nr:purine-nucleoside phosphorylase [Pseudoclavibacter soli]